MAKTDRDLLRNLAQDMFGQRLTDRTNATNNVDGFEDVDKAFL